ncbi:MAG TPA: polysaccharide deacetylase family protein [Bryobacteraceae bacterium]|nr:polysaccharide deacetylase family protein [Bryobacteraceae bacterium]
MKRTIIKVFDTLGAFAIGNAVQKAFYRNGFVRVLNYHETPEMSARRFRDQCAFYRKHFHPATPEDLESCIAGSWPHEKPGLVITFDDGFRSNYDTAAGIIEEFGFRGYFFIPVGYIAETREEADERYMTLAKEGDPEPRMTWDDCLDLAVRGHRVGAHTRTHIRLKDGLTKDVLRDEIRESGRDIRKRTGLEVKDFCWVGGEEWSYGLDAYREILAAGYERSFMTNLLPVTPGTDAHWIQRTNIESNWPPEQVRFYLSGLMDLAYLPKRQRLRRKLAAKESGARVCSRG